MSIGKATCLECGKEFERRTTEIERSKRLKRPMFCTKSCAVSRGNRVTRRGTTAYLTKGRARDEFSPFRWFMARVRNRVEDRFGHRGKEQNLNLVYLKSLWETQQGKCPFTGWDMELPTTTGTWSGDSSPRRASLDRIDSSQGYVQGNVRFICVIANYAKNGFDDKALIEFCQATVARL